MKKDDNIDVYIIKNLRKGGICIELQPKTFDLESTTIWSFPDRGNWATHSGKYRGNWSPYIPRNLITRYSKQGDWILDQFVGSGTTLVEAKLLGRNAIGVDVNADAVKIAKKNINFESGNATGIYVKKGNATNLGCIRDESIDLICTHPPYADIIKYSKGGEGNISLVSVDEFLEEIRKVAEESYRILKKNKICAVMMGDIRKYGNVVPLGFRTMEKFLQAGFKSKEIIIKKQHNCMSTKYWENRKNNFLLLAHEYIFVFQK